jgi:hypothetical protein
MRFLVVMARTAVLCVLACSVDSVARAQEQETVKTEQRTSLPDAPQAKQTNLPLPPRRLSFHERLNIYYHSVTNAETVAGPAFGAGVNLSCVMSLRNGGRARADMAIDSLRGMDA